MAETAQQRIESLAKEFVGRLQEIARDEVLRALGGAPGSGHRRAANGDGRGAKRDPAELARLGEQFVAFVSKHPGLRIEQINAELGTDTKTLALPIRKLIASRAIKTEGSKRSTKYFAGSNGGSARSGKKRGRGKRAR